MCAAFSSWLTPASAYVRTTSHERGRGYFKGARAPLTCRGWTSYVHTACAVSLPGTIYSVSRICRSTSDDRQKRSIAWKGNSAAVRMQADPERTSPSPHRRRLTDGGLLRRSYRLLGMIAVATLGTLLVAAYLVPFPARAWYRETLAPSADGVSLGQDVAGYLHIFI